MNEFLIIDLWFNAADLHFDDSDKGLVVSGFGLRHDL